LIALRKSLRSLEVLGEERFSKDTLYEKIFPLILDLELAMKTELGVFASDGYHSPAKVKPLDDVLESLRNLDREHPE
jgi:hypothetical protein